MRRRHQFIYLAAGAWLLTISSLSLHLSGTLQLASIIATLLFAMAALLSLFELVRRWREAKAYLPLATCLATVLAALLVLPPLVSAAQAALFRWSQSELQALVDRSDVKSIQPGQAIVLPLSTQERRLVRFATARRNDDGTLFVSVLTETGFPVLHAGYLYSSSGSLEPASERLQNWPVARAVSPNWYRVHD